MNALSLLCLVGGLAWSATPEPPLVQEPATRGLAAWERGALPEAIQAWTAALQEHPQSAPIHYNLGLAYYRSGELARAIAAWRTVMVLEPRNRWAQHNLAVARSELPQADDPVVTTPVWLRIATPTEYAWLALVLMAVASAGAVRVYRHRGRSGLWWWALGLVALALAVASLEGQRRLARGQGAVVLRPASLRALALPDSDPVGTLAQGAEVAVLRTTGPYLLVQDSRDRRGYLLRTAAVRLPVGVGGDPPAHDLE